MAKATRLTSMSVDALLQLRDDIGKVLTQKADALRDQLSKMAGQVSRAMKGGTSSLVGRKAPVKYPRQIR
jgi:hypothetical protein